MPQHQMGPLIYYPRRRIFRMSCHRCNLIMKFTKHPEDWNGVLQFIEQQPCQEGQ